MNTSVGWNGIDDERSILVHLFTQAIQRVDPAAMVQSALRLDADKLRVGTESVLLDLDLSGYSRILVLGLGKAGASMAQGLETVLAERQYKGLIVVKQGHGLPLRKLELMEAAHPVPDESSARAAERLLALARTADEHTLALVLLSGGGSALACAPLELPGCKLSLADKSAITSALLACGADIAEINTVRRHFSAFKGGRLAEALFPARSLTLILSDVVGDDLHAIASGPTVPDRTGWPEVHRIFERHGLLDSLPVLARKMLVSGLRGKIPDTPKPGSSCFTPASHCILGSNRLAAQAAVTAAANLGFEVRYLGSEVCGDAEEAARWYFGLAVEAVHTLTQKPRGVCLVGGGETTVRLKGKGKGGRNQQLALRFLACLEVFAQAEPDLAERIHFLSAGTDGNDGPTDAAGAFADMSLVLKAHKLGFSTEQYLAGNDAYSFFKPLDGLLITGPTSTNVCDLQLLYIRDS